jgi:hypothetical protein
MRLGGEMHDGIRLLFAESGIYQRLVADISIDEAIACIVRGGLQILHVGSVSQLIGIDDTGGRIFSYRRMKADSMKPAPQ